MGKPTSMLVVRELDIIGADKPESIVITLSVSTEDASHDAAMGSRCEVKLEHTARTTMYTVKGVDSLDAVVNALELVAARVQILVGWYGGTSARWRDGDGAHSGFPDIVHTLEGEPECSFCCRPASEVGRLFDAPAPVPHVKICGPCSTRCATAAAESEVGPTPFWFEPMTREVDNLAQKHNVPITTLGHWRLTKHTVRIVPKELAIKHAVVALGEGDGELLLAVADPGEVEAIPAIESATGLRVQGIRIADRRRIERAIRRYYPSDAGRDPKTRKIQKKKLCPDGD